MINLLKLSKLDFYCRIYKYLRNYPYVPFWIMTPFRRLVRNVSNKKLSGYLDTPIISNPRRTKDDLIVSLTSFPARIDYVWQVVECMLRQTVLPHRIILWLSEEQFPSRSYLPNSLTKRENDVFEIQFVKGDIRSHKKYYYAAKEFPNYKIFIVDDDIFYPTDIIERSLILHDKYPDCIISNYGIRIAYDSNGHHLDYNDWPTPFVKTPPEDFFFGSGGGTLIEPSKMHKDLTNIDLAMKLCPLADDVWLNTMARLNGVKTIFIPNGHYLPMIIPSDIRLASINNGQSQNDEQIANVEKYYRRCFDRVEI